MVCAALADDDLLLAVALDEDGLLDLDRAVLLLRPALGLDRRGVGQFLVEALEELLAGDLGGELAERQVGDLVLRIEPRPGGMAPAR